MIVPTVTPSRASACSDRWGRRAGAFETIVVDNGTGSAELDARDGGAERPEVLRRGLQSRLLAGRQPGGERAQGEVLVLLNDDSVVDPGFVERIPSALDPGAGVVMAAGVMRDAADPALIETAGIEIDRTLLAFDYLNGEPIEVLEAACRTRSAPAGRPPPSARRRSWRSAGSTRRLFAYGEDVDLVLRCGGWGRSAGSPRTPAGPRAFGDPRLRLLSQGLS